MQPLSRNIEDYPDGIVLCIDKPYRWTSADVIRKVKYAACRHFGKKNLKVGHAGTLDPLATGVLLICIGAATKRAEELQASEKQYLAGVTFGATTPSYDLEKEIDREFPLENVSLEALEAALPRFIGEQMQVAPLFSAKSVDGVRAYETARKLYRQGRLEEAGDLIRASKITISGLEVMHFGSSDEKTDAIAAAADDTQRIHVADIAGRGLPTADILVTCSKGTYIRALARDLGEALGSGAFLSSLRRTRCGDYRADDALTLQEVLDMLG